MQWQTIKNSSNIETYHLLHQCKNLLTLTVHPFLNAARVESETEKRVFLIRKEGFRRNKTVLRTEYGIKIGELGVDEKSNFVDLKGERFYYEIKDSANPELVLYKTSINEPIITCGFAADSETNKVRINEDKTQLNSTHNLLIALCWFMLLPATKVVETTLVAAV